MKKRFFLIGTVVIMLAGVVAISSCKKEKTTSVENNEPVRQQLAISDFYNSGCLPRDNDKASDTLRNVILERRGNDVFFEWPNFYNDCTDSIVVEPYLTGDTLEIWVKGILEDRKKCVCFYDIKATIKNLKSKRYLINTYDAVVLPDGRGAWDVWDSVWMDM